MSKLTFGEAMCLAAIVAIFAFVLALPFSAGAQSAPYYGDLNENLRRARAEREARYEEGRELRERQDRAARERQDRLWEQRRRQPCYSGSTSCR